MDYYLRHRRDSKTSFYYTTVVCMPDGVDPPKYNNKKVIEDRGGYIKDFGPGSKWTWYPGLRLEKICQEAEQWIADQKRIEAREKILSKMRENQKVNKHFTNQK